MPRIALILLGLAGLATGVAAQISCNTFELSAGLADDTVSVTLATDLPDDTRISVQVSRRYWRKGRSGVYTVDYLASEFSVTEMKVGLKVDVSQKALDKAMERANAVSEYAGNGKIEISELDPRFKVRALTTQHQPNKAFGTYNSKLEGLAVIQENEFRGCRKIRWVNASGDDAEEKRNAAQPTLVKPRDFEVGKVYVLRRKVDLVARPEGEDAPAFRAMAPESGVVYVDRRVEQGDWTWFRVAVALAPDQAPAFFGWARHDAFDVKKHRETAAPRFVEKLDECGFPSEGFEKPRWQELPGPEAAVRREGAPKTAVVVLEDGMTREDAILQARMAAWDLFDRGGLAPVVVRLQRAGDTEPRAGEAWILPASVKLPEALSAFDPRDLAKTEWRTTVRIDDSFFQERPQALAGASRVILKEEGSFEVALWADPLAMEKGEKKARIAAGSTGRILKHRYVEIEGKLIVRYEVEAENGQTGWVAAAVVTPF